MKTTTSISALVVGMILTGLTIQSAVIAAIEARNRTKWGDPDLSGTYISNARQERCNILVTGGTMPAVHITQSPGLLTLRSNTTRVLHIQRRTHGVADAPIFIRYGLARWEDDNLVGSSRMPTAPLWSEYQPQPPGVVLVERFSLTNPTRLTYEIGYKTPGEPTYTELKTTLVKCPGVS